MLSLLHYCSNPSHIYFNRSSRCFGPPVCLRSYESPTAFLSMHVCGKFCKLPLPHVNPVFPILKFETHTEGYLQFLGSYPMYCRIFPVFLGDGMEHKLE